MKVVKAVKDMKKSIANSLSAAMVLSRSDPHQLLIA
jgi:hypothetical protein